MTNSGSAGTAKKPGAGNGQPVPTRYTWKHVRGYVAAKHASNRTMRQIAGDINKAAGSGVVNITHRTVQRILNGEQPRSAKIRRTLGQAVSNDYDSWLARNLGKILDIVAWAQTPPAERAWPPRKR